VIQAGTGEIAVGGTRHRVNRYVLKKGAATALAFYWYQGRGRVVANEYQVKWNLLRDAALAGHTEEALVRVVVPVRAPTVAGDSVAMERAHASASALGEEIGRLLIRDVSRVLPGSASLPREARSARSRAPVSAIVTRPSPAGGVSAAPAQSRG
jgi:hypothetical protein